MQMDSPANKYQWLRRMRDGGNVQRCHTLRMVQPQRVNSHSWGVAMVLLAVGVERAEPLVYALLHDNHETYTGDTPAPAKWDSHALNDGLAALERAFDDAHGISAVRAGLTPAEHMLFAWADLYEFVQCMIDEATLGNRTVWVYIARCVDLMRKRRATLLDALRHDGIDLDAPDYAAHVVALEDALFNDAAPYTFWETA
jgi:hypothetical protein